MPMRPARGGQPVTRPARPMVALQMMTDNNDNDRRPRAEQYWPIRRISNDKKLLVYVQKLLIKLRRILGS